MQSILESLHKTSACESAIFMYKSEAESQRWRSQEAPIYGPFGDNKKSEESILNTRLTTLFSSNARMSEFRAKDREKDKPVVSRIWYSYFG